MFSLIKVFIVLLSFSESLATKCVSLIDEPCMIIPTLIGLNPVEFKYYPFMIRLDKCNGSCNVLSPIISVEEKKDISVKVFTVITNNEAKAITKYFSCICKCKFDTAICNSNQKWSNKTCQCEFKNDLWNRITCICEYDKCLKSNADTYYGWIK